MRLQPPLAAFARIVDSALAEDLGDRGDITSDSIVPAGISMTAVIRSREAGRVAGADAIGLVLGRFPAAASANVVAADGSDVGAGSRIAVLSGSARTILSGERVILNLLGRLSGIATATHAVVRAVEGTGVAIKDTRKTTPGLRLLEKYAVAVGGGVNHRSGLYDAVLIKDNHIAVAGSLTTAVERVRARLGAAIPVQVEVDSLAQLEEALACGVGSVLLDNMAPEQLRRAVAIVDHRCHTEASGGITLANVHSVAETGVDSISLGWLTHSARSLDLGLDIA
jgi:nicotinate-nucleotide pyrophosphorylase (carboxylating)